MCSLNSRNLLTPMLVLIVMLYTAAHYLISPYSIGFNIVMTLRSPFQRSHVIQTITTPSESLLSELRTVEVGPYGFYLLLLWLLDPHCFSNLLTFNFILLFLDLF
ncbi:hypothetical protein CsSME_00004866 [Camellia sinensis var. sinensis]